MPAAVVVSLLQLTSAEEETPSWQGCPDASCECESTESPLCQVCISRQETEQTACPSPPPVRPPITPTLKIRDIGTQGQDAGVLRLH
ncbi:Hypothetical protein SMAX5B_004315 [Scophthalmus maximus]|uniref:Uncharacterized protein n=1 Tax=Scophthalmus maximus TaxID=52904 RepID=A0A2U9B8L7_SCOMX|nr:Hypothetical protein SMAX5B_004315 [Scophthalmus maximus]